MRRLGAPTLLAVENRVLLLTPLKHGFPLVSVGDWFWNPLWITKPIDAQVSWIKCCRSVHTVKPPHLQTPNRGLKTVQVFIKIASAINLGSPLTSSFSLISVFWNLKSSSFLFYSFVLVECVFQELS